MPTLPLPTRRLTRHSRHKLPQIRIPHHNLPLRKLTPSARPTKPPINKRRPKAPLRNEEPEPCNGRPAQQRLDPSRSQHEARCACARVAEEKGHEREGYPAPAALDEDDVEDIGFLREVAGRDGGVLVVRLRDGVVGRGACLGRDDREEGAKDEH